MKKRELIITIHVFLILELCLGTAASLHQKAETTNPIPTFSPPEGNTTFIDGTTWCVAHPSATQSDLQIALDWACGLGATDCSALQPDGPCFQPNTLLSHASYAFNAYYQQNGNNDIACNFGRTATLTKRDPSYGSCKYMASEASFAPMLIPGRFTWMIGAILTILHFKGYGCIYYLIW